MHEKSDREKVRKRKKKKVRTLPKEGNWGTRWVGTGCF